MSGDEAELQMDELADITDYIHEFAGDDAEVIFGHGIDAALGENIRVTVIATGFASSEDMQLKLRPSRGADLASLKAEVQEEVETEEDKEAVSKRVFDLESSRQIRRNSVYSGRGESDDASEEEERPAAFERFGNDENGELDEFELDLDGFEEEVEEDDTKLSPSFTFEFEKPEPRDTIDEDDEDDFLMEIEDEVGEEEDFDLEELLDGPANPVSRKVEMIEARRAREEKLLQSQKAAPAQEENMNAESFREKWDVPAFERKKVKLRDVPHSSERNISKFNLTDENQILGNNKFLHDNVD